MGKRAFSKEKGISIRKMVGVGRGREGSEKGIELCSVHVKTPYMICYHHVLQTWFEEKKKNQHITSSQCSTRVNQFDTYISSNLFQMTSNIFSKT